MDADIGSGFDQVMKIMTGKDDFEGKEEQIEALEHLFNGEDVVCVLPTGYGKSYIFFSLVGLYNIIDGHSEHRLKKTDKPMVLIVSPLLSLMAVHVKEATNHGLNAIQWPSSEAGALIDECDMIFSSPESLTSKAGIDMLASVASRIIVMVTDEVHVAPKWGKLKKGEKQAFRAAYSKLHDLRSTVMKAPILALTATATTKTRVQFQRQLGMKKPHVIVRTPDRNNITISVEKVQDSSCFDKLLDELRQNGILTPKTIIYCKTVRDCTDLFTRFDQVLGNSAFVSGLEGVRLFAMYFHDTLPDKKGLIESDLTLDDGHYRVIFATNALGLGVNMKSVNRVFHYGCPRDFEDYVQEIGRAGRSGEEATAKMYYTVYHMVGITPEMKDYVKNSTMCRRKQIASHFQSGGNVSEASPLHKCCDVCAAICDCGDAHQTAAVSETDTKSPVRSVTDEYLQLLTDVLGELKQKFGKKTMIFGVPLWSDCLMQSVLDHAAFIDSVDYIIFHLPVMSLHLAQELFYAVKEVFDEEYEQKITSEEHADANSMFYSFLDDLTDSDFEEDLFDVVEAQDENEEVIVDED